MDEACAPGTCHSHSQPDDAATQPLLDTFRFELRRPVAACLRHRCRRLETARVWLGASVQSLASQCPSLISPTTVQTRRTTKLSGMSFRPCLFPNSRNAAAPFADPT